MGPMAPSEVRAKRTPPASRGFPGWTAVSGFSTIMRISPAGCVAPPASYQGGLRASACTLRPPALMRVMGQGPPAAMAEVGTATTPSPAPSAT